MRYSSLAFASILTLLAPIIAGATITKDVDLTFAWTGAPNASDFTVTFSSDISFTAARDCQGVLMVIKDTGNFLDYYTYAAYSGSSNTVTVGSTDYVSDTGDNILTVNTGYNVSSDLTGNDLYLVMGGAAPGSATIAEGTTVTYHAGTYDCYAYSGYTFTGVTLPTSGTYTVIFTDNEPASYINITTGASVPEPSEYAGMAGLAAIGLAMMRRRGSRK